MGNFVKAGEAKDLRPGMSKQIQVGGKRIALFNIDGKLYALDDACTHRGGPLSEGTVEEESVTCPWHGAVFDIKTGQTLGPPAPKGVSAYKVDVQGTDIMIELP